MNRRGFLKRMALAAAACAFIDVPWPERQRERERPRDPWTGQWVAVYDGVSLGQRQGRIVGVNRATNVVTVEWE